MKKGKNTLVFIYNSFNDPLFQNLVLTYLKSLSKHNVGEFHIITFEQSQYEIDASERQNIGLELKAYNMVWHPMDFHTGKFLLLKKAYDFIRAFFLVMLIRIKYKTKVIFAFANVSAAFSIVFAKVFKMKMIVYSYEPHCDFLAELGYWSKSGLKFKILNRLEQLAGKSADYIMTGTKYMVERLVNAGAKGKIYRAPTAVDDEDFFFRAEGRNQVRTFLGVSDDTPVFLYMGKFGGLYYEKEVFHLFGFIKKYFPNAFFLVVSGNDHTWINECFAEATIPDESYCVTGRLPFVDVKSYISAAEIGLSAVPPSDSQKFRSPTKVAEYLLCGIPYITCEGVSEDDIWALKENVGAVVKDFNQLDGQFIQQVSKLLNENKDEQRNRCRNVGKAYRSKKRIDDLLLEVYREI